MLADKCVQDSLVGLVVFEALYLVGVVRSCAEFANPAGEGVGSRNLAEV